MLEDDEESLLRSFHILKKYSECAGLKTNLEKTEAIWIGSKVHSNDILAPNIDLKWNRDGKFKLLGIDFDLSCEEKTLSNFYTKIEKIKSLLNSWIYRDLTYVGKITVIKSLALPILTQCFTVLPNPPSHVFKEIEKVFFSFLWNNKPDKIKRNVIINLYEHGGLKMPHIQSYCMGLKMTWINKILNPLHTSPWKTLIAAKYNKFGGDKIWMLNKESLIVISQNFNIFWKDIISNWGIIKQHKNENEEVLTQSIWFNNKLKIDNQVVFYEKWCNAGIFFLNDLLDENGEIFTLNALKDFYHIETNFLQYHSILHMIPQTWKIEIRNSNKLENISCLEVDYVKKHKKSSQFFYKQFLSIYSETPKKQQDKWEVDMAREIENWDHIYSLPFLCTKNNKMIMLQYKILMLTVNTNALLFECNLKETNLCTFCNETRETITHLFWECQTIRNFWMEIKTTFNNTCDIDIPVSAEIVILGSENHSITVNYLIILVKYFIYICKFNYTPPTLDNFLRYLSNTYETEKMSSAFFSTPAVNRKVLAKWETIRPLLDD